MNGFDVKMRDAENRTKQALKERDDARQDLKNMTASRDNLQSIITKSTDATALKEQQKVNDGLANENAQLKAKIEELKSAASTFAETLNGEQVETPETEKALAGKKAKGK